MEIIQFNDCVQILTANQQLNYATSEYAFVFPRLLVISFIKAPQASVCVVLLQRVSVFLYSLHWIQVSVCHPLNKNSYVRDYVTRNRTEKYSLECSVLRVFKATLGYTEKKVSGKSGWKVNGTQLFFPLQWKVSGSKNGTSKKAVLFFGRT